MGLASPDAGKTPEAVAARAERVLASMIHIQGLDGADDAGATPSRPGGKRHLRVAAGAAAVPRRPPSLAPPPAPHPPPRPFAEPIGRLACRPWHRGDLFRRLRTFSVRDWGLFPPALSPLACSRRGWRCVGRRRLACESCPSQLHAPGAPLAEGGEGKGGGVGAAPSRGGEAAKTGGAGAAGAAGLSASAAARLAARLATAHDADCPWREQRCARGAAAFPPLGRAELRRGHASRVVRIRAAACGGARPVPGPGEACLARLASARPTETAALLAAARGAAAGGAGRGGDGGGASAADATAESDAAVLALLGWDAPTADASSTAAAPALVCGWCAARRTLPPAPRAGAAGAARGVAPAGRAAPPGSPPRWAAIPGVEATIAGGAPASAGPGGGGSEGRTAGPFGLPLPPLGTPPGGGPAAGPGSPGAPAAPATAPPPGRPATAPAAAAAAAAAATASGRGGGGGGSALERARPFDAWGAHRPWCPVVGRPGPSAGSSDDEEDGGREGGKDGARRPARSGWEATLAALGGDGAAGGDGGGGGDPDGPPASKRARLAEAEDGGGLLRELLGE